MSPVSPRDRAGLIGSGRSSIAPTTCCLYVRPASSTAAYWKRTGCVARWRTPCGRDGGSSPSSSMASDCRASRSCRARCRSCSSSSSSSTGTRSGDGVATSSRGSWIRGTALQEPNGSRVAQASFRPRLGESAPGTRDDQDPARSNAELDLNPHPRAGMRNDSALQTVSKVGARVRADILPSAVFGHGACCDGWRATLPCSRQCLASRASACPGHLGESWMRRAARPGCCSTGCRWWRSAHRPRAAPGKADAMITAPRGAVSRRNRCERADVESSTASDRCRDRRMRLLWTSFRPRRLILMKKSMS